MVVTSDSRSGSGASLVQLWRAGGLRIGTLGSVGNFPGQFYKPRGVAADSTSGNIVVADTANHRL
jgi:DNA-binding beta-propeller fold protein YncE